MVDLLPVLRGVLPPTGKYILHASARRILRQHRKLPRLPGIQPAVNPPPDRAGAGHMPGALEDHRLEDNGPLSILAALLDSCELRGQIVHKSATDSPA